MFLTSLSKKNKKIEALLLYISIFLIKIPPFYLFGFNNIFFMTHNIARIFILIIFILIFFFDKEKIKLDFKDSLIILFFISQSLSVLVANNLTSFFTVYKDLIFSILLYYVAFQVLTLKHSRSLLLMLLVATIIDLTFELITFFHPSLALHYLKPIIYEKYWIFYDFQINRQRYFGESLNEVMFILIIFILIYQKEFFLKFFSFIASIFIIFTTLVSNWRTKVILFFFNVFFSVYFYKKEVKKAWFNSFFISLAVFLLFLLITFSSSTNLITSTVNRFLLKDAVDTETIIRRTTLWYYAFKMGLSSPLLGVGLGNYYDNLPSSLQQDSLSSKINRSSSFVRIDDPHNVFFSTFATSGLLGLISLILMLTYFLINDIKYNYLIKNKLFFPLQVVFWSFFIFSLLNPAKSFYFYAMFWFIRAWIEKLKQENFIKLR